MSDLKFVGIYREQNRDEPVRHILRLATDSSRIREVDLQPGQLAELAKRAVTFLAHHVDYRVTVD